jgi:aminotransferase MxcL
MNDRISTTSGLPEGAPLALGQSHALLARARAKIPGQTLSMMKRPEHFAPGSFPIYLARGAGARVEDVDGNHYVDFVCGLGANSLGHGHPALLAAAQEALEVGFVHSLPTAHEPQAAELFSEIVPFAEMVRFFKTGADATSAAVRLARAITGKDKLITVGYNGWHDHFMFDTPGVPKAVAELTRRMPLFREADEPGLLDAVAVSGAELAAVIVSVPYNRLVSTDFLRRLRETCSERGVLFVLDEIVTGFRVALGGVQELSGVEPDFACYSKALAAGMPLSAIAGPARHLSVMDRLQVSTTFGGETVSLAVCQAALRIYRDTPFIAQLSALGQRLREGVNRVAEAEGAPLRVRGYDAIPLFGFSPDPPVHARLMQEFQGQMARRGVLLRRDVNFICGAHREPDIDVTIAAAQATLRSMAGAGAFEPQRPGKP